jgi:hypothetical protein
VPFSRPMAKRILRCHECNAPNRSDALFCARCSAALRTAVSGAPYRKRRTTSAGAALGVAILAVLFTALFVLGVTVYRTIATTEQSIDPLAGRSGTTATTSTSFPPGDEGQTPTTIAQARGVLLRPLAATSSSALTPMQMANFRATNLLDEDPATAWIEGAEGLGIDEWVRFTFAKPVVLTRLEIVNGYQLDNEHFAGYARVRSLKIDYSSGLAQLVELHDSKDVQVITTRPVPTEWLKLTILSVHPDYLWDDAALSEVRIFEAAAQ